ncbi:peptidoglycan editing factor PgeF [bacterium]|nr:peptidoglycan editing factor PgeF [bacterium]MBR1775454.1 peptidoglycan editing factor PgeF [bacterium]
MFYFDEFNGYKILKSDYLKDINAFFTTKGQFPFNENLNKIGVRTVTPNQTHSDNIQIVDERDEYPATDSLIITKSHTLVYLRFADCTPIILYDKMKKIGAVTHAGWRGTAAGICVKTANKMQEELNCLPENIIALIGPAIGLCCYEVSSDVKEACLKTVSDRSGLYLEKNIDLKSINARQLEEAGIKKIDICPYCTSCNNDLFYSYRKENGTQERHYAALML